MLDGKLIEKLHVADTNKLCRLCLRGGYLRNIIGTKLPHMIETCFEVKITSDSVLPQCICSSCFRQIVQFYTYKQKVVKAQSHLQIVTALKESHSVIKLEKGPDLDENKLQELENVHEKIQKKTIELNECTQKIISYNFGPPPLVPIQSPEVIIVTKNDVKDRSSENTPDCKDPPSLPPLIPLKTEKNDNALQQLNCNIYSEALEANTLQDSNSFSCNICKEKFNSRTVLLNHLRKHKSMRRYLCNVCGKKYLTPSTFGVHMRTHTGEKPFECNVCLKRFVRWAGVRSHMIIHKNVWPFKCEICGKSFKISSNLYRHQKLHSGISSFQCSDCEKSFNQAEHLKVHERIYHTKEKPYLCSECGKSFVNLQRLKRHGWIHSGQKPYPCFLCPKAYTNAADLKSHQLKIHQGRTVQKLFMCSFCDKKFTHPCRLTKHMQYHKDSNK